MSDTTLFKEKAPGIMHQLMDDFEIEIVHAAAILGNIGTECDGFHHMHEIGQPEGKGGYGWAQWTGPRRREFFAWCDQNGMQWQTDAANYGFLKHELETSERRAIATILKTSDLATAVKAFERNYEGAGVPNYESRNRWAQTALAAFNGT
jgi:Phage tail lysozyme